MFQSFCVSFSGMGKSSGIPSQRNSHTHHRFHLSHLRESITWGKDHRGWFTRAPLMTFWHLTTWKGTFRNFHSFSVLSLWAQGGAFARMALLSVVCIVDLLVFCFLLFFFLYFFFASCCHGRENIFCLPLLSLDFDSMGAGYHPMSVASILTSSDSVFILLVLLGRMDGFIPSLFVFTLHLSGHLSYRSISAPPGWLIPIHTFHYAPLSSHSLPPVAIHLQH